MNSFSRRQNRKVSIWLAIALLSTLCLSVFFVHADVDHDCAGEDCPICALIQIARGNFQNLDSAASTTAQIERTSLTPISFSPLVSFIIFSTPVSEKIKLNN